MSSPSNIPAISLPTCTRKLASGKKLNQLSRAVGAFIGGVPAMRQVELPPVPTRPVLEFHAIAVSQTTGQTVVANIYGNGPGSDPNIEGQSVICPMLADAAIVAVGDWLKVQYINGVWYGFMEVIGEEPA